MSAPDLPRFKVASVTGHAMGVGDLVSTAWYVLDTWDNCRQVSAFPVGGGRGRGELAEQRCAELEAWHAEAMANDPA